MYFTRSPRRPLSTEDGRHTFSDFDLFSEIIISPGPLCHNGRLTVESETVSGTVTIPFTKTALAEYLCADRSDLTRELSNMEKEGLLSISGRNIQILDKSFLMNNELL